MMVELSFSLQMVRYSHVLTAVESISFVIVMTIHERLSDFSKPHDAWLWIEKQLKSVHWYRANYETSIDHLL